MISANKRGQMEVTFNWMYVLIAGAAILLFFGWIIVRGAQVSEEDLSRQVARIMKSIFTAASVSEKTQNYVDASGLADYTLYFNCEDGVGRYGIKDRTGNVEDSISPVFAPLELQATKIFTWSLPYRLPFKVTDLLFVTSDKTKYFVWGEDNFGGEFLKATTSNMDIQLRLNAEKADSLAEINPGKYFQIRIVDVDGVIQDGQALPPQLLEKLKSLGYGDIHVTAVSFTGSKVNFYRKKGSAWEKLNSNSIQIISLGGERDAAKYAAIFAGDDTSYVCNMGKALKRLPLVLEVYGGAQLSGGLPGGKLGESIAYYENHPELPSAPECQGYLNANPVGNLQNALMKHQNQALGCAWQLDSSPTLNACAGLMESAQEVRTANQNLAEKGDCITLY